MDTIKYYKLTNMKSHKVYRHITLQGIMDRLHLGYFKAKDFVDGYIWWKEYHRFNGNRLRHWYTASQQFSRY